MDQIDASRGLQGSENFPAASDARLQTTLDRLHAAEDRGEAAAERVDLINALRRAAERRDAAFAHRLKAAPDRLASETDRVGADRDRESVAGDRADAKKGRKRASVMRAERSDEDDAN